MRGLSIKPITLRNSQMRSHKNPFCSCLQYLKGKKREKANGIYIKHMLNGVFLHLISLINVSSLSVLALLFYKFVIT